MKNTPTFKNTKASNDVFFFLLLFLVNLPFLVYHSEDFFHTLVKFNCDELCFLENIDLILQLIFEGRPIAAGYNLYHFGYGSVYWGISSLCALPSWMFKSEQGMIISLRALSMFFSLGSFFLILQVLKRLFGQCQKHYVIILLCFFSPVVIRYSNMIHPETMYSFFIVLG